MEWPLKPTMTDWANEPDWHSVTTVQFGELIEDGWVDWKDGTWNFPFYTQEQNDRLISKIEDRYWFREISTVPPGIWKRQFLRKLREIMPKYIMLYRAVENVENPLMTSDRYGKSRDVFSDYPATRLGGNQDYASTGNDREYEDIEIGDWMGQALKLANSYRDVDVLILDELAVCFMPVFTANINAL